MNKEPAVSSWDLKFLYMVYTRHKFRKNFQRPHYQLPLLQICSGSAPDQIQYNVNLLKMVVSSERLIIVVSNVYLVKQDWKIKITPLRCCRMRCCFKLNKTDGSFCKHKERGKVLPLTHTINSFFILKNQTIFPGSMFLFFG